MKYPYLLVLGVIIVILSNSVTAWDLNPFADTMTYEKVLPVDSDVSAYIKENVNEKYGVITLSSNFLWIGTGKTKEYSLTSNTEYCLTDCEAEGRVTLYSDGRLFDDVKFETLDGRKSAIKSSQYFVFTGYEDNYVSVPDEVKEVCYEPPKDQVEQVCINQTLTYKQVNQPREVWTPYNGENVRAGDYRWKIKGTKEANQDVDFIPVVDSTDFTYWAVWLSSFNTNLISYYNFNEQSGAVLTDVVKSVYNGTIVAGTGGVWNATGFYNGAYQFGGVDTRVYFQNSSILENQSNMSWSMWVYPTLAGCSSGYDSLLNLGNIAIGQLGDIRFVSTTCQLSAFDNTNADCPSTQNLIPNYWNHVVMTMSGGTKTLYVNGTSVCTEAGAWPDTQYGTKLGHSNTNGKFKGKIDDFAIFNKSLSASEVSDLWANGAGMTYTLSNSIPTVTVALNSPSDGINNSNRNITFNWSVNPSSNTNVSNSTLKIWDSANGVTDYLNDSFAGTDILRNYTYSVTALTDDVYKWSVQSCYVNNSGSANNCTIGTNRTFTVDGTGPSVVATNISSISSTSFPARSYWYANISDSHIGACWYHTSDSATNVSISCYTNISSRINTNWTTYGAKWINVFGNDTFGNIGNQSYPLSISNISLSLNSPVNNYYTTSNSNTFNCSAVFNPSANIGNLSLTVDSDIIESQQSSCGGSCTSMSLQSTVSLSEGLHTWYCTAINKDNSDTIVATARNIYIDQTDPTITITNVTNLTTTTLPVKSTFIVNGSDSLTPVTCRYNTTQNTALITFACTSNVQVNWTTGGYKQIQVIVNDSVQHIVSSVKDVTIKYYQFNTTASTGVIEGESAVFTLTMNTSPVTQGSVYADLIYNGANEGFDSRTVVDAYTSIITKTLNIPSGAGNLTGKTAPFYWNITTENLTAGYGNQTVYSLSIDNCAVNTQLVYNFTIYNENTKVRIPIGTGTNLTTTMEARMYSLQDTTIQWTSNTTKDNANEFLLCVNTGWLSTSIQNGLDLQVTYDADGYFLERYDEQRSILSNSTVPRNVLLYLLPDTTATYKPYKINVKDANLIPVQDAVIEIYRYVSGTATSVIVEAPTTDDLGNAVGHLILSDAIYKIVIKKQGVILGSFNKITTTETSTCNSIYSDCFLNLQLTTDSAQFSNFNSFLNIYYNYTYNKNTRTITLQYSSSDGLPKIVSLNISRYQSSKTSICYADSTALADSLSCVVPSNFNGTILVSPRVGDTLLLTDIRTVKTNTSFGDIEGLRWLIVALLIPMLALMGYTSAPISILFIIVGLGLIFMSGLLNTSAVFGGTTALTWTILALIIILLKAKSGGQQNG
jgi:hypothetical protein